jgi:hypothetical protein
MAGTRLVNPSMADSQRLLTLQSDSIVVYIKKWDSLHFWVEMVFSSKQVTL